MTPDQIEDLAMAGVPLPGGLDGPDTLLFLMFRSLYDYAGRVQMPREQGRKEKKRIMLLYEKWRFYDKLNRHHVRVIRDTEAALSAYFREPSIENADRLAEAFQGALLRKP